MNLKKYIFACCALISFAATTASEEQAIPLKPRRNAIFSSVANNANAKQAQPTATVDFTEPTNNFKPQPLVSMDQPADEEPKSFAISSDLPKLGTKAPSIIPKITDHDLKNNESEATEPKTDQQEAPIKTSQIVEKKEPGVLYQEKGYIDDEPATVAFNFEDANLSNLLSYMEAVHHIKFITDDVIPMPTAKSSVAGHKITFRTNKTLARKESWDICITFLHIAGLDAIPMPQSGFYRLVSLTKANNEPIPTYIGVDHELLPDNDMMVRYVYFARNIDFANPNFVNFQNMIKNMLPTGKLNIYQPLKGLIFTDRSTSIKSIMKIIVELDRAVLPEVLSVVKIKRANASDVIKLYQALTPGAGAAQPQKVWSSNKKEASIDYFPQGVIMQPDERTNSIILLGMAKDVQRVEEFITKHVDVPIERPVQPIYTYHLQYTNAADLVPNLQAITAYNPTGSTAGQYGGVRDGLKYFQKMTLVADANSNSIIINATPEDFQALKPLIEELDVPQKQIGLEILFVQVKDIDTKTLGAQLSGPNGLGANVQGASL